jgi:hypothetical protein
MAILNWFWRTMLKSKNVPGRKTDVSDAVWIADLLAHGLIRSSFVPEEEIQELPQSGGGDLIRHHPWRKAYAERKTPAAIPRISWYERSVHLIQRGSQSCGSRRDQIFPLDSDGGR